MIVFKSTNEEVNMFEDAEGYTDGLAAESLSNQFNDVFKENKCEQHPDSESLIHVAFKSGTVQMNVVKYCCEEFNQKLIRITQNDNPF